MLDSFAEALGLDGVGSIEVGYGTESLKRMNEGNGRSEGASIKQKNAVIPMINLHCEERVARTARVWRCKLVH